MPLGILWLPSRCIHGKGYPCNPSWLVGGCAQVSPGAPRSLVELREWGLFSLERRKLWEEL